MVEKTSEQKQAKQAKTGLSPTGTASYSLQDWAEAARTQLKVPPEVAITALKLAKKENCTIAEAKQIIAEFLKREVK